MATRQIWPANGEDKMVDVEENTFAKLEQLVWKFTGGDKTALLTPDGAWELARQVILADRADREKRDRHARGDFGEEIGQALLVATVIGDETDGDAYRAVADIISDLHEMTRNGFTDRTLAVTLQRYNNLVDLLHKTDEMAVKLQGLLLALKGSA